MLFVRFFLTGSLCFPCRKKYLSPLSCEQWRQQPRKNNIIRCNGHVVFFLLVIKEYYSSRFEDLQFFSRIFFFHHDDTFAVVLSLFIAVVHVAASNLMCTELMNTNSAWDTSKKRWKQQQCSDNYRQPKKIELNASKSTSKRNLQRTSDTNENYTWFCSVYSGFLFQLTIVFFSCSCVRFFVFISFVVVVGFGSTYIAFLLHRFTWLAHHDGYVNKIQPKKNWIEERDIFTNFQCWCSAIKL